MSNLKSGVFISDIHLPDSIDLAPVIEYIGDLQPETIILGGDIIDATGLHASESMKAEQVKMEWFERDVELAYGLIANLKKVSPNSKIIYLEGNHEQRYARLQEKYPDLFKNTLNYRKVISRLVDKYVNYAQSDSYYKIGDVVFVHGDIFPDLHAKPYALRYSPNKVVYGHMHHFQAYTTHRALLHESSRYGVTAGCLSTLNPAWKKGMANQWVNGFISFLTDGTTTTPTVHLIEKGRFAVGRKIYGGK
ncbi:MAG: metallophosphoesterase [Nitrospiraceae bacterium]